MGKNIGDDLVEGKPTLPLIYALKKSKGRDAELINDAIVNGGSQNLEAVIAIMHQTGAITYSNEVAINYACMAKEQIKHLTVSPYRDALMQLSEFAITRSA